MSFFQLELCLTDCVGKWGLIASCLDLRLQQPTTLDMRVGFSRYKELFSFLPCLNSSELSKA